MCRPFTCKPAATLVRATGAHGAATPVRAAPRGTGNQHKILWPHGEQTVSGRVRRSRRTSWSRTIIGLTDLYLSRTRQGTTARDSCESDRSALSAATANTRSPSESLRTGTSSASLDRQTVSKRVRRGEEYESNGDLCRTRELTLPLLPLSPPFDRLRPSNVIASLTAATDDADATEQLSV